MIPYDEFHTVGPGVIKAGVIKDLVARFGAPVLFADDKSAELDAVRDAGMDERLVQTVRVRRKDSPHNPIVSKYRHVEVVSLNELRRIS